MASEQLTLARQLARQGKHVEAVAALEAVLRADASNVEALILISRLYGEVGKPQFSIQAAARAAQLARDNVEAVFNLALAYHRAGDLDKCDKCLDVTIARDPDWLRKQFFQQIKAAADVDENSLPGRVVLAFDRATEQPAVSPQVMYNLGRLLVALGALNAARQACESALEQDPEFAEAFATLGEAEFLQGRFVECIEWFDEARRRQWMDKSASAVFDRQQMTRRIAAGDITLGQVDRYAARALVRLGQYVEANRMMQSAIEWQPWDVDGIRRDIVGEYLAMGQAAQEYQGTEAALKIWESAEETARQSGAHELFLQLAQAYLQLATEARDKKDRHKMMTWLERARNLAETPPVTIPPEVDATWSELRAAIKQLTGKSQSH